MSFIPEDEVLYCDPSPSYSSRRTTTNLTRSDSLASANSGSQQSYISSSTSSSLSYWPPQPSIGYSKFSGPEPLQSIRAKYNNSRPTHSRLPSYSEEPPLGTNGHPRLERYVYTYTLQAGAVPVLFKISVEPSSGQPTPGWYQFRLSMRIDRVEKSLGQSVSFKLAVDPTMLDFVVFIYPGKSSYPANCLYSYRVWLRVNGTEHRLFGHDELWIGKDPDFTRIGPDASYARPSHTQGNCQVYKARIGKAIVQFFVRWRRMKEKVYEYMMEYDANGVGGVLMEDVRLLVDGDPSMVTFWIYSVPMNSLPAGAAHRLRVWLKLPTPTSPGSTYSTPYNESYFYHRIFKLDNFKLGAQLDFSSIGPLMIMGSALPGGVQTQLVTEAHELLWKEGSKDRTEDDTNDRGL